MRLEAWFETMRAADPSGYAGPVAHWWQNCMQYTGAALDWRYEGIILGYLALEAATGDRRWLDKARRAGDDLVGGQLETGSYRASSFELNPYTGGTPHEAAADIGLLALAKRLRAIDDPAWQTYYQTASRNLRGHFIGRLWDDGAGRFNDSMGVPSFVANKAATLCEALFLLAELSGDSVWIDRYALPTLDRLISMQVKSGTLKGAIAQNWHQGALVERYMPYYIARCVPALLLGGAHTGNAIYADAAVEALRFVFRQQDADGGFVQCLYAGGRVNRYPRWVAAVGDIIRIAALVAPYGFEGDTAAALAWMLAGQNANGGIGTARGFAAQVEQRLKGDLPEFRDVLPVCGWADKAFRCLAGGLPAGAALPDAAADDAVDIPCTLRGQRAVYSETRGEIAIRRGGDLLYRWRKGDSWAADCAPEMLWK
jgi:hypothetical protein